MVPVFNLASCPNLAVPAEVMQHVARIESGNNPFAIGVVGGRLERQPKYLGEAVATARMLDAQGYDYSLGLTQVHRSNLVRYGLDTFDKAFDGCSNAAAGTRILAECYRRSSGDWGKAFSCYYSGDFDTGYRDGYVQRILAALDADSPEPITVYPRATEHPADHKLQTPQPIPPGNPGYRTAIRTVAIDTAASALVAGVAGDEALTPGQAHHRGAPVLPTGSAAPPGLRAASEWAQSKW